MCLVTVQKEPIILVNDLNVFKLFKDNKLDYLLSPYQQFVYIQNTLYKTEIKTTESKWTFDSIDNSACISYFNSVDWRDDETNGNFFGEGFHSIVNPSRAKIVIEEHEYILYNVVIPAGSEVYYGVDPNLIISNQIIIKEQYK